MPIFLLIISISWTQASYAQETLASTMARAIARMMESMGMVNAPVNSAVEAGVAGLPPPVQSEIANIIKPEFSSLLEGIWEDNQGGLLIIQGRLYRIYSACQGHLDGEIQVGMQSIELTNSQTQFTQSFEYVLNQGRLALRNRQGELFVYRKLILGH